MTGTRLISAVTHLTVHVISRGMSAVLSLSLFSLFAREYSDAVLADIFFFGFIYGFVISTMRMIPQLVARISGTARRSLRLRQARDGIASLKLIVLPMIVVVFFIAFEASNNIPISLLAAVIIPFAVADIDLFRSALNKSSLFSFSFSIGSGLALLVFLFVPSKTRELAILVVVIQWLPVGFMNARAAIHMLRNRFSNAVGLIARTSGATSLAIFDGFIINFPFLGFWATIDSERVSLAISIRLFVSSLPLLTLMVHWANMSYFDDLGHILKIPTKVVFALALITSGLVSGGVFILLFSNVSGRMLNWEEILGYVILLAAFSTYFSNARFLQIASGQQRTVFLSTCLWLAIFGTAFISLQAIFFQLDALFVIFLQAGVLLLFAGHLALLLRQRL